MAGLLVLALAAGAGLQLLGIVDSVGVVVDAVSDAQRILMVRRPEPWQKEIRRNTSPITTIDRAAPRIVRIFGLDPTGEFLYLAVDLGDDFDKSTAVSENFDAIDESDASDAEDVLSEIHVSICRINLTTSRLEWITRDQSIKSIYRRKTYDQRLNLLAWITESPPRFGSVPSRRPDRLAPRTLWLFDPANRSTVPLIEDRSLTTRFSLADSGSWLAFERRRTHKRGTLVVHNPLQRGNADSPPAPPKLLDAQIHHIYDDGPLALASIKFPNFVRAGFIEFLEIDLQTGKIHSALDQVGLRRLDAFSLRMLSDDTFAVRARGRVRVGEPYSVISLYNIRPLRHIVDVPGFAAYPTHDPDRLIIIDTRNNRFVHDKEAKLNLDDPVVRILDLTNESVDSFPLREMASLGEQELTPVRLMKFWRSAFQKTPVSPQNDILPILSGAEDDRRIVLLDLQSGNQQELGLPRPPTGFLWSPSGNSLAVTSVALRDLGEVAAGSDAPGLGFWDRGTGEIFRTENIEAIPIRWIDEDTLMLLSPHLTDHPDATHHPSLLVRYSLRESRRLSP